MTTTARSAGGTVTLHVPMHFRRRSGRKTVASPAAQDETVNSRKPPVGRADPIFTAVARAFYWRKLIDAGTYASIAEIAATEGVSVAM